MALNSWSWLVYPSVCILWREYSLLPYWSLILFAIHFNMLLFHWQSLCSWDPCKRPTAAEALQHPFFQVTIVFFLFFLQKNQIMCINFNLWTYGFFVMCTYICTRVAFMFHHLFVWEQLFREHLLQVFLFCLKYHFTGHDRKVLFGYLFCHRTWVIYLYGHSWS